MAADTWEWTNAGTGSATDSTNWTLSSGTTTVAGYPQSGDIAIVPMGTMVMPNDATLGANTIEVGGTAGAAAIVFSGDAGVNLANPTIDQASTIESLVQGQTAAGSTVLDIQGTFINQGTIAANGPAGSSFTIDVEQGTAGNAGIAINYNEIDVDAGNAMTIIAGNNAALYNAGLIQVQGGSLDITTSGSGAFDGGYAPVRGVLVVSQGGTVEINTGYTAGVGGASPMIAFADDVNNWLKLDQVAQFGDHLLGFGAGDTIDIGAVGTITGYTYTSDGILALQDGSVTVASLGFASGNFNPGSFAVGDAAGSFGIGTLAGGDVVITTSATNVVWNSTSGGAWNTGSNWAGGTAPGTSDTAVILGNGGSSGVITTGTGSIGVGALLFAGDSGTLQVDGSLSVGPSPLEHAGGTIEVTGSGHLSVAALSQLGGSAALVLDSGAVMDVAGHANYGAANAGTIAVEQGHTLGMLITGSAAVNGGTLTSAGFIAVGLDGSGTPAQMDVTNAGTVTDTSASTASGPAGYGVLTISGPGVSWTDAGDPGDTLNSRGYMIVGYNDVGGPAPFSGAATLTVTNGATLTETTFAIIGDSVDSAGIANVTSGGVWNVGLASGGWMNVGRSGAGTLNISGGGTVAVGGIGTFLSNGATYTAGGIGIGHYAGGAGTVTVADGLLTSGAGIGIGQGDHGVLEVLSGGTVALTAAGHGIGIGQSAGVSGTLSVSGPGALLSFGTAASGMTVGQSGTGVLDIGAGGAVTLASAGHGIAVGQSAGSFGTITVSGSTALLSLGTASVGMGIGQAGTGGLAVMNGGTVLVNAGGLGVATAGGVGGILVSGPGSEIISRGTSAGVAIGKAGRGGLVISSGGEMTIAGNHGLSIGGTGNGPTPGAIGGVALQGGTVVVNGTTTVAGGTLDIGGNAHVWAGSTLSVDGVSGVDIGGSGSFVAGAILTEAGHVLMGDGLISAALVDNGTVIAASTGTLGASTGGTLEVTGSINGSGTLLADDNMTLRLDGALGSGVTIDFTSGGPESLILGSPDPSGTITNAVVNFGVGDRIEFGGLSSITSATLNGTTLSVSGIAGGNPVSGQMTDILLASGAGTNLLTGVDAGTGNAYVELASPDTWEWINPGTASGTIASNWSLVAGPATTAQFPQTGDTVLVPAGTVVLPDDAMLQANTIEVAGTAGAAGMVFNGGTAVNLANPTLDQASTIESLYQGQTAAGSSVLDSFGIFINQGEIAANGPTGSSFTIDVEQGTSGVAGALINYGKIDVAAGNAMTIVAGPTAALFNVGEVQIDGGYLDLTTTGSNAIDGGLAATKGFFVLSNTGTLEVNTAYPSGATGSHPQIAFADSSNSLLRLDQPGNFGGRILGFGAGDTIDLGAMQAGTLVYNSDGQLTIEDNAGSVVASLVFASGAFSAGTFAVSGTTAGNFLVTGSGTDLQISTTLTNAVWTGASGIWTTAADWSGGAVPGASDTALIAGNTSTSYVVSTGSLPVTVNGLIVADSNASLQIASAMTVTPAPVQGIGGTIEVLGGASLTATSFDQSGGASLLLDEGATLDLLGHPNLGFADAGTLVPASGGTIGLLMGGTATVTGAVVNAGSSAGGTGGFIAIGANGSGTPASMLVQDGSSLGATVTDTYALLASDPTSFGSLTISGPNTTWTDAGDPSDTATTRGYMLVGNNNDTTLVPYAGTAQLLVTNQATLTETAYARIGNSVDSAGSVTVSDHGTWQIGTGAGQPGFLDVGRYGNGTLVVTDNNIAGAGGTVLVGGGGSFMSQGTLYSTPYSVDIGKSAGAEGTVTVTGQGSTLAAAGQVRVGDIGAGGLDVANGGVVDVTTSAGIIIGFQSGGRGGVLVDNGLLEAQSGSIVVGRSLGVGVLTIENSGEAIANTVAINGAAALNSNGSLIANTALTVGLTGRIGGAGGAIVNTASSTATVNDYGTIEAVSGAFEVNGTLAGSGALQIDPGATLVVGGAITGTDSFVFGSGGQPAMLDLANPGSSLTNAVLNLQDGDQIELENFATITSATVSGSTITVTGSLVGGGAATYQLTDVSFAAGASQTLLTGTATDPFSGATAGMFELACFATGTPIATADGETPVERLRPGDLVRTASGALRPVRWIGFRRIDFARHADPRRARPIRVAADAVADGAPHRDVWLSPDHAILYRGGLIPIRLLVNGSTIRRDTRMRAVTYYHVELDSHDVLLAAGLPAESYIDTGNRGVFANADAALVLHPDFLTLDGQALREAGSCAPFVADPVRAEAAWRRLADRALALGCTPPEPAFTDAPALALRLGSRRARPMARDGATYRFALPAGEPARLVSRSAYPSDARPWEEDQRRLGVMVRRLRLWRDGRATPIALDDPALGRGWWAPETDGVSHWRWTDGDAALPVLDTPAVLEVELARTLPYPLRAAPRRAAQKSRSA